MEVVWPAKSKEQKLYSLEDGHLRALRLGMGTSKGGRTGGAEDCEIVRTRGCTP